MEVGAATGVLASPLQSSQPRQCPFKMKPPSLFPKALSVDRLLNFLPEQEKKCSTLIK